MVVATGTGAIEVERAALGKHTASHLLDVLYHLRMFHVKLLYCCKDTKVFAKQKKKEEKCEILS